LAIVFGTDTGPTDLELKQRVEYITVSWQPHQSVVPCQARTSARPWRTEEGNQIRVYR
jgi:hypothetical protein